MNPARLKENIEQFNQIHIDVARNATDDFNLFHDHLQWSRIFQNPFHGPIVLGFQIESLIENKIFQHRQTHSENVFIQKHNLNFSNYQFSFANAIKPDQHIVIDIRKTKISGDKNNPTLSNRVTVKSDNKLSLIGFKKETCQPLFLPDADLSHLPEDLADYADRSILEFHSSGAVKSFFLKRKYMNISNAKNFLCGSRVEQRLFFDELKNYYQFPEIFPCAFISCALLENFLIKNLDFERSPMVYGSHKISVNRRLLSELKSNDQLHILIYLQTGSDSKKNSQIYECYGLLYNNAILFRALVELIPLEVILKTTKNAV